MTETTDDHAAPCSRGVFGVPNRDSEPEDRGEASKKPRRASGDFGDGPIAFFGRAVMVVSRKAEGGKEPIDG